jgi:hypothetical protein
MNESIKSVLIMLAKIILWLGVAVMILMPFFTELLGAL